ncbi:MAG: hypothetical protein PHE27_07075 [Alphaproteobacteria bacterium]|nr:hypothetical protein [Alphaproteobacteria bacterium]
MQDKSSTVASVMSAFFPGLGHLYIGRARRGLLYLLAAEVLCFVLGQFGAFGTYLGFVLFYLIHSVWVFLIYDSYVLARQNPKPATRWYMNTFSYVSYALLFMFVSGLFGAYRSTLFGFDIVPMADDSMSPVISKDDLVLIDVKAYKNRMPSVGEAVLIPGRENQNVRRVKSVAEDTVELVSDDGQTTQDTGSVAVDTIIGQATSVIFSPSSFRIGGRVTLETVP